MKIIDSQIHIWSPLPPGQPLPPNASTPHGEPYTAEMAIALMDGAGVESAVLVPPSWAGFDNSCCLNAAAAYPGRFAVVGRYNHEAPDAAQQLETWLDQPGMVGMRVMLHVEPLRPLFVDPAFHWFWAGAEATGLPLNVYASRELGVLPPILDRHPRLRIIIDHAGRVARGPKDEAAWDDIADLLALARYPTVAVKVSSLPSFSTQPFPYPNLHGPIRAIYDAFGAGRMIWGSDVTRLTSTYDENIRLFSEGLDFLSETDKEWIFGRTLTAWCLDR